MKYPQLVSSRAVNEISDWLIKQLEDLDIEQPSVYSRLLLSLLHTPFKVNAIDILEIPQLKDHKQPFYLLNKNNEELKRLAAVESLMEVSSEENKSNIVSLIDELHSKLQKIESNCEDNTVNARSANLMLSSTSPITSSNSKIYKNLKKIKRNHGSENPTKNYYLAFPALNSSKKASSTTINCGDSEKQESLPEKMKDSKMQLLCWSNLMTSAKDKPQQRASKCDAEKLLNSVKIKTPRRKRGYCRYLNKQTDVQSFTKSFDTNHDDTIFSPKAKNGNKKHQKSQFGSVVKNSSSKASCSHARSYNNPKLDFSSGSAQIWDMDFKGHWEMDRDLIGEFIQQQQLQQETNMGNSEVTKSIDQVENNDTNYDDDDDNGDDDEDEDEDDDYTKDVDDDSILMKFLPKKLMDDDEKFIEATEILKSKFDANVKALWNDVDKKPLTQRMFNDNSDNGYRLMNSFSSERNLFTLFNFNVHQPHPTMEVIAPSAKFSNYTSHHRNISDIDYNNNNDNINKKRNEQDTDLHDYKSSNYLGTEKFIKLGTNLQTSIWSDEEFSFEPETLIYKDVVNHKNDDIYKQMKSFGSDLKSWPKFDDDNEDGNEKGDDDQDSEEQEVSLFNHSARSAFKRFRPIVPMSEAARLSFYDQHHHSDHEFDPEFDPEYHLDYSTSDSENLLISNRTHFSPIMRDGHMFTVDRNWEDIRWERSASGNFIYNNRRYMEYTALREANDKTKNGHSMNNIDVLSIEKDAKSEENFSVRFVIKDENNKGCQTDINDLIQQHHVLNKRNFVEINEDYCKYKIYDEYFKDMNNSIINDNKWRHHITADDSNDYSFFSVHRVKNPPEVPKTLQDILMSSNSSSSSICTITSSYETSTVDPFESWRNVNGVTLDSNYQKERCMHSLWKQCNICYEKSDFDRYCDEKTVPANRLMKDELRMDGDEIMSVIQNLYITEDYCEDDEEEKNDDEYDDMQHLYMNMLDDCMDGSGIIEEDRKFYENTDDESKKNYDIKAKEESKFVTNIFEEQHRREEFLQLEGNFNEVTLAKMQWQWNRNQESASGQEKYLKLLRWIQATLLKEEENADTNNNYDILSEDHRPKNRKRRHSTCQNFLEKKSIRSQDHEFTYHLNMNPSPTAPIEDNFFTEASKMFEAGIEKILLVANTANANSTDNNQRKQNDESGPNYHRNILHHQHALIKQLDLARPLTR